MNKLIKINEQDNVWIVRVALAEKEEVRVDGKTYMMKKALGIGHKIAAKPLATGDKIIKFGVSIGSATQSIAEGDHIHLHNMKSDYLPTYTLDNEFIAKH